MVPGLRPNAAAVRSTGRKVNRPVQSALARLYTNPITGRGHVGEMAHNCDAVCSGDTSEGATRLNVAARNGLLQLEACLGNAFGTNEFRGRLTFGAEEMYGPSIVVVCGVWKATVADEAPVVRAASQGKKEEKGDEGLRR